MHKDILQRFIFEKAAVRGEWVRLNESFQTIIRQHNYPLLIQRLLGELLVVVTLLRASVKFKGRMSVQFQGNNKLKLLMAETDEKYHIRGLATWLQEFDEVELAAIFKKGHLLITIDPEAGGQRYQGIVEWERDTVLSIEKYFLKSEQIATRIWIGINEKSATGLLLQMFPSHTVQDEYEWEHLTMLADTLTQTELQNEELIGLLKKIYTEEEIRVFDPSYVQFGCHCQRERCENALKIAGFETLKEELATKKYISVTCDFCNKEELFSESDIATIFQKS